MRHAFFVAAILASSPVLAQINKCQVEGRVVYQQAPCPVGSRALVTPEAPPQPSAYEAEAARQRARDDIAAAKAIREHEEKVYREQAKQRTQAAKQTATCSKLRDRIREAEAQEQPSKSTKKKLKSDRGKYEKECGGL